MNLFILVKWFPFSRTARYIRDSGTMVEASSFRLCNEYKVKQKKSRDGERYIVCSDITWIPLGLGAYLMMLEPCVRYARRTGRTLIIDWRGNPYTAAEPGKNLFPLLFEQPDPSEIGIRCVADNSVSELQLPQPILGPSEAMTLPSGDSDQLPYGGIDHITFKKLLVNCVDVEFPTVMPSVVSTWPISGYRPLGPLTPASVAEEMKILYRNLHLKPQWEVKVSEFYQNHMSDQPVVGVHVRHGNGEGTYRNHFQGREIDDFAAFMDALAARISRYAYPRFGKNYTVFLCTDSDDVVNAMKNRHDSVVSRPIWRPDPGEGVDFDHAHKHPDGGIGSAADALIDMQLLAKCDVVLATRASSFTRHIPYIMEKADAVFLDHRQTARI